jgi:hypothetical protein
MIATSLGNQLRELLLFKQRVLYSFCGRSDGPLLMFSAGIHGNEPAGVLALQRVFGHLSQQDIQINGSVLAFVGNRNALNQGERFAVEDLNRLWTDDNLSALAQGGFSAAHLNPDRIEMEAIHRIITAFEEQNSGKEHFFIDLHTTSAPTVPFAVVDRNPRCIEMAQQYPLPVIINLNEFIKGTVLNYLDKKGFQGLVFEAGIHHEAASVDKHEAIIWLSLVETGLLPKTKVPNYQAHYDSLRGLSDNPHKLFKLVYREAVREGREVFLKTGLVNFQKVSKGEFLGEIGGYRVEAPMNGRIFMPLYQSRGQDAFFIVQRL